MAFIIINPLEQFRILVLKDIEIFGIDISITNSTSYLFYVLLIVFVLFYLSLYKVSFLPTSWQYIIEQIYIFILQLVRQQIANILSLKYFPLIFTIFIFILLLNLSGLLPYGFTVTGHIAMTFQIAFSMFVGITIIGFFNNKLAFLSLFVPKGVPIVLIPFLVLIEVVSYLIRPFSLAIRLFANMLAGHTLLNIIASFNFFVLKNFIVLAVFPVLFLFFILVLEICIAFVQAYVFAILISIYLNDVYASH